MADKNWGLDDLPMFSAWPGRLLGIEPWEPRRMTPEDVIREYERDKWGPLLKKARAYGSGVTVDLIQAWEYEGVPDYLTYARGQYRRMVPFEALATYLDHVTETLSEFLPAEGLVELGAGYGVVLLNIAKRAGFSGMKLFGGEYVPSGRELIRMAGDSEGFNLKVGPCDLTSRQIVDFAIPEGCLIFTSYAVSYAPVLGQKFVDALLALRPKAVIHFEPCFEHCDQSGLLGLMQRRYIELNDYNTNLADLLRKQEDLGRLRVVTEERQVFGFSPLLVPSVIVWEPVP